MDEGHNVTSVIKELTEQVNNLQKDTNKEQEKYRNNISVLQDQLEFSTSMNKKLWDNILALSEENNSLSQTYFDLKKNHEDLQALLENTLDLQFQLNNGNQVNSFGIIENLGKQIQVLDDELKKLKQLDESYTTKINSLMPRYKVDDFDLVGETKHDLLNELSKDNEQFENKRDLLLGMKEELLLDNGNISKINKNVNEEIFKLREKLTESNPSGTNKSVEKVKKNKRNYIRSDS